MYVKTARRKESGDAPRETERKNEERESICFFLLLRLNCVEQVGSFSFSAFTISCSHTYVSSGLARGYTIFSIVSVSLSLFLLLRGFLARLEEPESSWYARRLTGPRGMRNEEIRS